MFHVVKLWGPANPENQNFCTLAQRVQNCEQVVSEQDYSHHNVGMLVCPRPPPPPMPIEMFCQCETVPHLHLLHPSPLAKAPFQVCFKEYDDLSKRHLPKSLQCRVLCSQWDHQSWAPWHWHPIQLRSYQKNEPGHVMVWTRDCLHSGASVYHTLVRAREIEKKRNTTTTWPAWSGKAMTTCGLMIQLSWIIRIVSVILFH